MNESTGFLDDEEETLPGELPFDQELDFNEDFTELDDYSIDIWEEDDEDLESDDDY